MSLIVGNLLNNVKRIYAFGPIYELLTWHEELGTYTEEDKNYFYKCTDNTKSKYFDIKDICSNNNQNTLIFYGGYNKDDKNQDNIIKKKYPEFKTIPLKTDKHCGNLSHFALLELLTCSDKIFHKIKDAKIKKFVKESYLLKKLNMFSLLKYLIHHKKN